MFPMTFFLVEWFYFNLCTEYGNDHDIFMQLNINIEKQLKQVEYLYA